MIRILLNAAMQAESQYYLKNGPYEQSESRRDYANGFKPNTLAMRMGKITVDVPQVRKSNFYPSAFEKGCHSELVLI
jgi:putative transposase